MILESNSPQETHELGRRLGATLAIGDVVALIGPLGTGKTTLVRGIAEGAGVVDPSDVNSPTFVIVNEYQGRLRLYHIDTYRLRHGGDLDALGFDEMLAQGAVLIEWADRVEELLPADCLSITLESIDDQKRRLNCVSAGVRSHVLLSAISGNEPI